MRVKEVKLEIVSNIYFIFKEIEKGKINMA
jgi:hypothetical protein